MKKRAFLVGLILLLTVCLCTMAGAMLQSDAGETTLPAAATATDGSDAPAAAPSVTGEKTQVLQNAGATDHGEPADIASESATVGDETVAQPTTTEPAATEIPAAQVADADVISAGSDLQLFWDDHIVDTANTTATLQVNNPIRRECVMTFDKPWEGDASDYHVIFWDDSMQVYRMYYLGWSFDALLNSGAGNAAIKVCYAESTDGLTWTKPNLGIHSYNGSTNNNIVLMSSYGYDNFFVFKDQNPSCPASQKYKAVAEYLGSDSYGSLHIYASADGYNFTDLGMCFSTDVGTFDSVNTCYYNVNDGYYYLNFRAFAPTGRIVRVAKSTDFLHWSTPQNVAYTDGAVFQLYTNNVQPYYRNTKEIIAFPTRYNDRTGWTSNYDELTGAGFRRARMEYANRYGLAITDALFMTSHDGYTFHKFNEAWCPPGPENGVNWIYGDCYFAYGMVETPSATEGADNEISMYAFEGKFTGMLHDSLENASSSYYSTKLYRYTSRIDGFACYKSTYAEQTVTTKPFTFTGNTMKLNFKTSAGGHVYVKVLDQNGNQISGYTSAELFGDSTDRNVTFDGGAISALAGRTIKLQFVMSDASIYSFCFQ